MTMLQQWAKWPCYGTINGRGLFAHAWKVPTRPKVKFSRSLIRIARRPQAGQSLFWRELQIHAPMLCAPLSKSWMPTHLRTKALQTLIREEDSAGICSLNGKEFPQKNRNYEKIVQILSGNKIKMLRERAKLFLKVIILFKRDSRCGQTF